MSIESEYIVYDGDYHLIFRTTLWHKTNKQNLFIFCLLSSEECLQLSEEIWVSSSPKTSETAETTSHFHQQDIFLHHCEHYICHQRGRAGTFTTCSCIVFLGSDGGNLPAYSASSLEDIPCSALAPQNAIANRDGREESHDHAAALILCWMGHREAALELCALTTPAYHCQYYDTALGQPDQFSSCHWTRGQLSSSFPPVLFICRMFRKCVLHTALFLTKTYAFKAAYDHTQLRNTAWSGEKKFLHKLQHHLLQYQLNLP